jgi:hypothetical protein
MGIYTTRAFLHKFNKVENTKTKESAKRGKRKSKAA